MILVTGAAGFIGSHLCERLLADGRTVVGIDNFDPYYDRAIKERNLAGLRGHPRFSLVEVDICDADALADALAPHAGSVEAIVHLAALVGVRPSLDAPVRYHEVNVLGTTHLLELAAANGIGRFILASSSSVYGVNPRVPWREDDRDLLPISPYASSKLAAEMAGHVYSHLHGIRFLALRFFTVYGPRQRPDLAIARFARAIREGRPIPVFGDGTTRRDYTYVGDIVEGIVQALGYEDERYALFNLGNDNTVALADMIEVLGETLGRAPIIERRPLQPGDVPQTWADISRARERLGWRPATSFPEGIREYVRWLEGGSGEE